MAGLLSFSRAEAVALPLTAETVKTVISGTRKANLNQLVLALALSAALWWAASLVTGGPAWILAAVAALSSWGILATGLSTWDHFRVSIPLGKTAESEIAKQSDPEKFWWVHRGLFPVAWTNWT